MPAALCAQGSAPGQPLAGTEYLPLRGRPPVQWPGGARLAVWFCPNLLQFEFAPPDDPWLEARDCAMVELLYGSGLRVGELIGLDVQASKAARGWVDLRAAEAHVLGKGSKRRSVPVGKTAIAALERWLELRGPMGTAQGGPVHETQADAARALFNGRNGTRLSAQSVWQRLRRRSLQAGVLTPVHPHMLRHSFASHLLQSSGDLRAVQELLGHANISTTQVYTRLDFQHLAETYDKAHPRARAKPKG